MRYGFNAGGLSLRQMSKTLALLSKAHSQRSMNKRDM
jgi:hypothetical protein